MEYLVTMTTHVPLTLHPSDRAAPGSRQCG